MKNVATLLILIGCLSFTIIARGGENTTTSLTAEKICSPRIDIFSLENVESLLGVTNGEKIANYEIVLSTAGINGRNDIYKFDTQHSGDFKAIMAKVKEHAAAGSILFVDEIKTTSGASVQQAGFYLR